MIGSRELENIVFPLEGGSPHSQSEWGIGVIAVRLSNVSDNRNISTTTDFRFAPATSPLKGEDIIGGLT